MRGQRLGWDFSARAARSEPQRPGFPPSHSPKPREVNDICAGSRETVVARDCVVELVGLELATKRLWKRGSRGARADCALRIGPWPVRTETSNTTSSRPSKSEKFSDLRDSSHTRMQFSASRLGHGSALKRRPAARRHYGPGSSRQKAAAPSYAGNPTRHPGLRTCPPAADSPVAAFSGFWPPTYGLPAAYPALPELECREADLSKLRILSALPRKH